jgi:sulfate permease, SulP family
MEPKLRLASALRETFREGYGARDLRSDLEAGCIVGIVALPLSMALAIASGVAPQYGLVTAVVAGGLCALLGGSRVQVSGPTAAFVAILAPIAIEHGHRGLGVEKEKAGILLVVAGLFRLGRLVQFMPYPVTIGFTAGIGISLMVLQLQPLLGLDLTTAGTIDGTPERLFASLHALGSARPYDMLTAGVTLAVLLLWKYVPTRVPAALVALPIGALVAWLANRYVPGADVVTLASRFGTPQHPAGIPQVLPALLAPWNLPGAGGLATSGADALPSLELVRTLFPSAVVIAVLAAIESLLSAVVSDGMTGRRHDPNVELIAIGASNVVAPFFGGIAATGAIARTATNARSGARSPIASMTHAAFVLAAMLLLAPALGLLPMASLAALLMVVAWNMSEAPHVLRMVRTAPRPDLLVLLTCLVLTVVFDLTISVGVGVGLAGLLFMQRMIEVGEGRLLERTDSSLEGDLPDGLVVFEIAGPLFFGAAHKATSQLVRLDPGGTRVVVLDLTNVPVVDSTGLVNLNSAVAHLVKHGATVLLSGVRPGPYRDLERAGLVGEGGSLEHHSTLEAGVRAGRARLEELDRGRSEPPV